MTHRTRTDDVDLVPDAEPAGAAYDHDFYSWSLEQARLVRQRRWHEVDCDNVADEIELLGRERFNKLESALRVLMLHMLKWDHRPDRRSRSWSLTIRRQRLEIDDVLADNPALKSRTDEAVARAYRKARLEAAGETGVDEASFPDLCPYSWSDIVSRAFPA